ncbi:hypothetical protein SERLADRAFT_417366 [Serpula lacrymans var. lacrymans S7.9]|uniref:Uncharacterized protein n=1 Tax=Serpula lacrymans var. lacrymans (strain S7.9) TaxID=578457 RepID=F8P622_SERL9|nr:uncharacterized protein SERLADRAFT_417366 [Serpula lacrymans var. lacrymans S7.9]EGO20889.1 hypothetical protein SERLADRAFT_417366 [Serpula lacrymans var. lacrymans S7.9]
MDSSSRMDQGLHSASSHPPDRRSSSSSPSLPEIPPPELDLTFSLDSILNSSDKSKPNPECSGTVNHGISFCRVEKVQKRASNVFKLTQENEKLKEELRAMTARLEAAERKRAELAAKQAHGQPQSFKADGRF